MTVRFGFLGIVFSLLFFINAVANSAEAEEWVDIWFHASPYTTYDDLNVGGTCAARWSKYGSDCPDFEHCIRREFGRCVEKEICAGARVRANLCTSFPWYTQAQCYTEMKIHNVEWLKACPKGKIKQYPASRYLMAKAKYVGPGRDYDEARDNIKKASGSVDTSSIWLDCKPVDVIDKNDASVPELMRNEWGLDFGAPNPANLKKFALMGCSNRQSGGKWNPALGESVYLPVTRTFPEIPDSCLGDVKSYGPEVVKMECKPQECNMATLEGCDFPQGIYEFYLSGFGLRPEIDKVGPGPTGCPHPSFVGSDKRWCGNKPGGCTKDPGEECRYEQYSYYKGVTKDQTPVPEQRMFISSVAVAPGQPQESVDAFGNKVSVEKMFFLSDFSVPNASNPEIVKAGVAPGATRETVYFPDEVPARNGVLVLHGNDYQKQIWYMVGRTPIQVRSMACPKRQDAYMPLQNITLGQTKWNDLKPFYEQDKTTDGVGLPPHPAAGEGDSCNMVAELAKELPKHNILSEGQDGFGLAHSVSTAVNQLLKDRKKTTVPILTVALTEPMRDCVENSGRNPPPYPTNVTTETIKAYADAFKAEADSFKASNPTASFYKNSETKWGSSANKIGAFDKFGKIEDIRCANNKFTDAYSQALKDAAKRLKDAGGYVVAVALSCKTEKFKQTLIDISTGHMDLMNMAPEGVFLDSTCDSIMGADGKPDPNRLAASMYTIDTDEDDNMFFRPAFAVGTVQPLFGTINDVYAELAWVVIRNQIGQEVCANQADGYCDDVR